MPHPKRKLNSYSSHSWQRKRQIYNDMLIFCSNDYLGLAKHPKIIASAQSALQQYGVGSGASQLVCGHSNAHAKLEQQFADYLGFNRALYFANGYMANLAVLTTLALNDHILLQDKLNHASLIDAGRFSSAKCIRYAHQNLLHLQNLLVKNPAPSRWLVTDGVFSTQGEVAKLDQLSQLAKKHHTQFIVDDAHGIAVLGETGRGSLEYFNLNANDVDVLICPLGKAFGLYGAIVASTETHVETLIQFARPYIYTTAPPPALASAASMSLQLIQTESWRREKLHELITYFKTKMKQFGLNLIESNTAIQSLPVTSIAQGQAICDDLKKQGILVYLFCYPTVPKNQTLLRITLSATHHKNEIDKLIKGLANAHAHTHT